MSAEISYRRNYLHTYIWQAISVLLGFASLFIVIPYLSSDKTLYGIYSVCSSLTIFFSYADLGFLSACNKYAAEYYIRGEKDNEIKIIGFTAFIMISVFIFLAIIMFFLGLNPTVVIPELEYGTYDYHIAQCLLIILSISCPILIAQRILNTIFTIRVQDYIFQRFSIVGNVIRILSVFFFFGNGRYMLIEYYLFYQFVTLLTVTGAIAYTKRYEYSISKLIKSIKFDKQIFKKVKAISGATLLMTLSMIVYYELDLLFISRFMGLNATAIYGASLSILFFIRQFCSIVYSPYSSRYNHFVGKKDISGLCNFTLKITYTFTPIIIIPIVVVSLFSKPFIISWIGENYVGASLIVSLLVLSFIPNCITSPLGSYFVSTEKVNVLVKSYILLPIIYWGGIIITFHILGLTAFAVFKTVAPMTIAVAFWVIAKKIFVEDHFHFLSFYKLIKTVFIPILLLLFCRIATNPFIMYEHNKIALFVNLSLMGLSALIGLLSAMAFDNTLRNLAAGLFNSVRIKLLNQK